MSADGEKQALPVSSSAPSPSPAPAPALAPAANPAAAPAADAEPAPLTATQEAKRLILAVVRPMPKNLLLGGVIGLFIAVTEDILHVDRAMAVIALLWTILAWTFPFDRHFPLRTCDDASMDAWYCRVLAQLAFWNLRNFVEGRCGDRLCLTRSPPELALAMVRCCFQKEGELHYTCHEPCNV